MVLLFGLLSIAFIEDFVDWYVDDMYPWVEDKFKKVKKQIK